MQSHLASTMAFRNDLLSTPCEYFEGLFGAHVRTVQEKVLIVEQIVQHMSSAVMYQNDTYVVTALGAPPFIHLVIRRHDWEACNDWRDFQQLKNEIVGSEYEAVELFPAESRLIDTSNTYHLWVHCDPTYRFPMGLHNRLVVSEPAGLDKQRAFA
jgi:hypothetical protein